MNGLNGKVALVTGGSKGIGRATCLALAKGGASVVINYSSDSSAADELVSQIGSDRAISVKADAGSVEGAEQMVKATMEKYGQLDVVIANAGAISHAVGSNRINRADISPGILPMKSIEDTTEQDFDSTYRLNVKGPYFLVQVSRKI